MADLTVYPYTKETALLAGKIDGEQQSHGVVLPEVSQSRIREAAIAPFDPSQRAEQVWQYLPCFAQMTFRERGGVRRISLTHLLIRLSQTF
jgi:hypothetical protein